jgi:transposase
MTPFEQNTMQVRPDNAHVHAKSKRLCDSLYAVHACVCVLPSHLKVFEFRVRTRTHANREDESELTVYAKSAQTQTDTVYCWVAFTKYYL